MKDPKIPGAKNSDATANQIMKAGEAPGDLQELDRQLVRLLDRRAAMVAGDDVRLDDAEQRAILQHIASACSALVRPEQVAFLGPEFSYSHLAAIRYFGEAAGFDPVSSIPAVFEAVSRDPDVLGIVPIENSTDGRVVDTLGKLIFSDVTIVGEVSLEIHHQLLSNTAREQITEVHSKPQALSQCRSWLANHLPNAELIETNSTGIAAKLAATKPGIAAIASLEAGRQYELKTIAANIEDNPNNVTRFVVLGHQSTAPTGHDKTSLICQVPHQPGALADLMMTFKDHSLNMTWIESFPIPGRLNEYFFFIEFDGHQEDDQVREALKLLAEQSITLRVLGAYPRCS